MALEVWSEMQFYNNVQFDKNLIANGNSQFQKSTFLGKTIFRDSISAYTNIFVQGGIKSTNIVLPSEYNNYELDLDKITTTIDTDYYLIGGTAIVGDKLNYTNIRCIQVPSHILIEQELMKIDIDVPAATYKLQVTGTKTNLLGLIIYVNKEGNTIAKGETSIDKTFYITVDSTNPKITIIMATSDIIKRGQIFSDLRIEVLQRLNPPITFNTKEGVISSKRPESFDLDNLTMIRCSRGEPIYFDAEKKYIKSQFCIQLDSNNGAVTLRNTPDGTNETIYGGYVTLYRPTGMGSSETRFDTLYLDEYKSGSTSIGSAIKNVESRLDSLGFEQDTEYQTFTLDNIPTSNLGNCSVSMKVKRHKSGKMAYIEVPRYFDITLERQQGLDPSNINVIISNLQGKEFDINLGENYPEPKGTGIATVIFFTTGEYWKYAIEASFTLTGGGKLHINAMAYPNGSLLPGVDRAGFIIAWNTIE